MVSNFKALGSGNSVLAFFNFFVKKFLDPSAV
jgi:hypothetical protein